MSWYECPKCWRELTVQQACDAYCKHCGDVVPRVRGRNPDAPVNLNTATKLELQRLAGFGETAALSIVRSRENKKFTSIEQVLKCRAVGKKTFEKVRDRICV